MNNFSIMEAGFHTFVMAKRRPAAFVWLVMMSVLLMAAAMGALVWAVLFMIDAAVESGTGVMAAQFAALPLMFFGSLFAALILYAGWWRFLVGRKLPSIIPFRIGADEGRTLVVSLVHMALLFGVYLVLAIPMMFISVAFIGGAMSGGSEALPMTGFLISMLVFYGVVFVLGLVFSVKLVPGYPMTVIERRIVVFDAWKASAGVFWKAIAAMLIPMSVFLAFEALYLWQIWWPQMQTVITRAPLEPSPTLEILADPGSAIGLIVAGGVGYILMMAFLLGPPAYIAVRHCGSPRPEPSREPELAPLRPLSTTQVSS